MSTQSDSSAGAKFSYPPHTLNVPAADLQPTDGVGQGPMSAEIAHELGNLVSALRTGLIHLEDDLRNKTARPASLALLQAILAQADQLNHQLHDSRSPNPVEPVCMDLAWEVGRFAEWFRPLLPGGVSLEVRAEEGSCWVLGDQGRLGRLLLNLCLNARDAMPQGGKILIEVERTGKPSRTTHLGSPAGAKPSTARLVVADTGRGIAPDLLERVFEPFFTTKPAGTGMGLGLTIVKEHVESLGGSMALHSQPGTGTEVTVYLPLCEAEVTADTNPVKADADCSGVILARSQPQIQGLLAEALSRAGHRVVCTESARQTLAAVEALDGRPAVLVWEKVPDIRMDRSLLCQAYRHNPRLSAVVIVECDDTWIASADTPTAIVLRKPFTVIELVRAVGQLLNLTDAAAGGLQPLTTADPTMPGEIAPLSSGLDDAE